MNKSHFAWLSVIDLDPDHLGKLAGHNVDVVTCHLPLLAVGFSDGLKFPSAFGSQTVLMHNHFDAQVTDVIDDSTGHAPL
jgi:hypothetical protein